MIKAFFKKFINVMRKPTARNARWMIAEQMVRMIISVLLGSLTARYLGPSNYGVINYGAAYVAFFTSVCTLGLEGIIIKEMVNNREAEGEIVGTGLVMRLAASALSIGTIMLILQFTDRGDTLVMVVTFLQALVLVFQAFELIDFWFQSYLRSKYVAIIKSVSYVLVALYKVFILVSDKSVEWFAFSTSLDFLLIAIMLLIIYRRNKGPKLSFSFATAKRLIKQSYHFILSGVIVTVYSRMDTVMIRQMLSDADVGLYSSAITVCNYWILIPLAIINSMRPSIMEQKKTGDEASYLKRLRQLYAILIWSGIFVSLAVTVSSKLILFILYGAAYTSAAVTLSIAIWFTTFSVLGTARGIWIVCENKNAYVKHYVLWGAVINLGLNAVLIPFFGINGAAAATLITQMFTCLLAPMLYKATRSHTRLVIDALFFRGIK